MSDLTTEGRFRYRSHNEITLQILNILAKGPEQEYRVMGIVGMSWQQTKRYSARLTADGMIKIEDRAWQLTAKGRKYRDALQAAEEARA